MLNENIKINKIASLILDKNWENGKDLVSKYLDKFDKTFISLGKWEEEDFPFENENIIYFHCLAKYPHNLDEAIERLPKKFENPIIGYSDHSIGIDACLEAIKRGAKYIEKHFTTDHSLNSETEAAHLCSMDYNELATLRREAGKI